MQEANFQIELFNHVRIYDTYGTDHAFEGDWLETCQPKEDCKGYQEDDWDGIDA